MRTHLHRLLSPPLFGLILFLFFLPFVTVSCPGFDGATMSGTQLAFGTTVDEQDVELSSALLGGFAVGLIGFVVSLVGYRMRHRGPAFASGVLGALGAMCLILFRAQLVVEMREQEIQIATASLKAGYWLCLSAFVTAAMLGFYCAMKSADQAVAELGLDSRDRDSRAGGTVEGAELAPARSSEVSDASQTATLR
jgi:uncharacterized membrane protein